jgi:phage baseplate assembly protein W
MKDLMTDMDTRELLIENGDFAVRDSDAQHIQHILQTNKGENTQFPLLGAGILRYLNMSGSKLGLKQKIRKALQMDGYRMKSLRVNDQFEIEINATR